MAWWHPAPRRTDARLAAQGGGATRNALCADARHPGVGVDSARTGVSVAWLARPLPDLVAKDKIVGGSAQRTRD
jgi:hypothetical protein